MAGCIFREEEQACRELKVQIIMTGMHPSFRFKTKHGSVKSIPSTLIETLWNFAVSFDYFSAILNLIPNYKQRLNSIA